MVPGCYEYAAIGSSLSLTDAKAMKQPTNIQIRNQTHTVHSVHLSIQNAHISSGWNIVVDVFFIIWGCW